MRSIFDILHKNFQEDQLNFRRFPGFPGVVDILKVEPIFRHTTIMHNHYHLSGFAIVAANQSSVQCIVK